MPPITRALKPTPIHPQAVGALTVTRISTVLLEDYSPSTIRPTE